MADDTFRQQSRKKVSPEDFSSSENLQDAFNEAADQTDPLRGVRGVQQAMAAESGRSAFNPNQVDSPFEIHGGMPAEFRKALQERRASKTDEFDEPFESIPEFEGSQVQATPRRQQPQRAKAPSRSTAPTTNSDAFASLIDRLAEFHHWEEFEWPSKGRFYNNVPPIVHIRAMTGEEEQILATPRFVKRGRAIDMIFQKCIQERIDTSELLSVDRTHLLIFLRGISYTPEYDVEIKCPECSAKFSTVIDLNMLDVNLCPDDFGVESLSGELPATGFRYRYRLSTGADELAVTNYREKRIQMFGDATEDDTLLYRTALLLEEVEGVSDKKELGVLMKRLPIADVAHLRNEINEPPFGVNTDVGIVCPSCTAAFEVDLPLETNFFFPRKRETKSQA